MPSHRRQWQRWALAALLLVLFLAFVALGTWQIQRRAWKLDLIERVAQRVGAPPVPLPPPADWPAVSASSHEYLPVVLQGRWLQRQTLLVQAVSELGSGFWVMTPLQADGAPAVWVNRGFVPQAQRAQWLRSSAQAGAADGQTVVQGLLRVTEPNGGFLRANDPLQQRWYSRDVAAMSRAAQIAPAAPFFVDAGLPGQTDDGASAGAVWPRPGLTVVRFANSHLVYALTWYGLALMVVGAGWAVAGYERRRASAPSHPHTPSHDPATR